MGRRNRHKERAKHGGQLADHRPPELHTEDYGLVTPEDRRASEAYLRWLCQYVNAVYDHGDRDTLRNQRYQTSEVVHWHNPEAQREGAPDIDATAQWNRRFGGPQIVRLPNVLSVGVGVSSEGTGDERLTAIFDSEGELDAFRYSFSSHGDNNVARPAPEASGKSMEELHEQAISRRAARIIHMFRSNVLGVDPDNQALVIPKSVPNWLGRRVELSPEHLPALVLD
ncbi:hypothetical protein KC878_01755 [Candidatus Saccharibacteria bacterium]|nr:hypothetical protein [Candidatus Saccharibacteria bacterium]MCB9821698.1 hypothetical protein [Candidatus Nomurabacteria bacterium]